ncbi:3-phosphoshikimate 1-carboxyvinyltransferase [Halobacteriales archaeon SW_5_70_135]|nr:MAG: 3-phosphoshikimate 1-carboxyvinyltransferase [Halobacteriales archaeon SW_5_70_135]
MDARIEPSTVDGTTAAPPSKSYTHRALLAAAYGDGARVVTPLVSADTRATARAVEAFGARVVSVDERDDDPAGDSVVPSEASALAVEGFGGRPAVPADVIDCANSGTTLRLTTATAGLADGGTVLTGDASLRSRPQGPLLAAVESLGGRARTTRGNGRAPMVVEGPIEGGRVSIPGDVSSQFVTALLFAGARTDAGVRVDLETPLKSVPYVDITREVLAAFGVETERTAEGFAVGGDQSYARTEPYAVPGDFSSASYLLAAGAVAAPERLVVENLYPNSQGDAAVVDVLDRMGATVDWDRDAGAVAVERSALRGTTVDVSDTPDLLPTVAAVGAVADGETRIENCEHVRHKETDRVAAMAEELDALGAAVEERPDTLVVRGGESRLTGARVDGRGDHRLAMALSVVGLVADGGTTVAGAEHVAVSFPEFFETLADSGASVDLLERPTG